MLVKINIDGKDYPVTAELVETLRILVNGPEAVQLENATYFPEPVEVEA